MINSFAQYLHDYDRVFRNVINFGKYKVMDLTLKEGQLFFGIKTHPQLTPFERALLMASKSMPDLVEVYLAAKIAESGPKIFQPTDVQFALLEQMELNIPMEEYVQPFETIVIDIPSGFAKARRAILPQAGIEFCGEILPDDHQPVFVIINHDATTKTILAEVAYSTGLSTKLAMVHGSSDLETLISKMTATHDWPGALPCSEEEYHGQQASLRAALNYGLLLDEIGIKSMGDDKHRSRLKEFQRKAQARNEIDKVKQLALDIKLRPVYYSLQQDVTLCRTVSSVDDLPNHGNSRVLSPHHRRGFYKMQPHGPKNSLRKRIRIPSVFVNSHLFAGAMLDAVATYHN